jgi:hypothetical protein
LVVPEVQSVTVATAETADTEAPAVFSEAVAPVAQVVLAVEAHWAVSRGTVAMEPQSLLRPVSAIYI